MKRRRGASKDSRDDSIERKSPSRESRRRGNSNIKPVSQEEMKVNLA